MCGIAGLILPQGDLVPSELMDRMTDVLRHRGPDDRGVYCRGNVGLGHRRLAILDLSPHGRQPMSNEDGTVWVIYNGEIYNCGELRAGLEVRGHRFRSTSDTEVLVHLYEEQAEDLVHALNGIFAFALWDEPRQRLLLARDRLGVKPLFYAETSGGLAFGSEIKAVLESGLVERRVDPEALSHFLSLNYLPAPWTMLRGIRQLEPGERLIYQKGASSRERYWSLPTGTSPLSEPEAAAELDRLLADSVRGQMLSDVPIGGFLSGGLDSSTVAYYMRQASPRVQTFSIGFQEQTYDESPYARQVAARLGTDHRQVVVTPDARQILEQLVYHSEEPTADASMIAVWYLSEMTRQHVTVALSGDGADELLAGYETYQANELARLYRRVPLWLHRRVVEPLIGALPASEGKISLDYKLKRFIAAARSSPDRAHCAWRLILNPADKRRLVSPAVAAQIITWDTFELCRPYLPPQPALNDFLAFDTRFYLPSDMLTKVDRMSMAHALEVRVPFLDHRLVEFLARLPAHYKLRRFRTKKYLLKQIMRGRLPGEIVDRPKAGFNVPLNRWFKHELREYVRDVLSRQTLAAQGFFQPQPVEQLLDQHQRGEVDWSYQIYPLLIFTLWHRRFLES